jgi:ribosomal protein S27AE
MRQAMETIEKIVSSILSHAKGVQKDKNTNTKPLSLPEVYPPSLAYFLSKSQANPSKRQLDYSSYFRTAYKVGIVGVLVMVISLFLMMRSLETAEWWKEVINKGAFLLVGLSFIFAGINLWMTAKKRLKEREISEKIRSLWKLLKDQGKMKMEEIATHLGIPRADVPAWIYRLGASEAFTGYVDWKDGVLYSVEAGLLGEGKDCPQCGGRLELAKKGIFQCQHCGAEVFLKK